ncbi:hypothetical protein GRAN_1394 [Granulicella sibirica]|uniref:Uncharacterized protein n=1 Tax=Granulicella sibirica TaxID=2479048 RepID=A0A4V1L655_9BACT|nr:hypothetical protein GRAN_1394 [Granulicella sibirica]
MIVYQFPKIARKGIKRRLHNGYLFSELSTDLECKVRRLTSRNKALPA